MSEGELLNLVFLPGFSTAEKVTNLSGRGVGMDVVKTNIDRVNGTVDLQSYPGKGTTIKIKIPLTLAIVRAVIIQSNGKRFAIPQVNIQELVRLDADRVRTEIESVHGVPVYRMRGRLLPLVYLNEELKLAKQAGKPEPTQDDATNIVVLQANDHPFGLVVDRDQRLGGNRRQAAQQTIAKPQSLCGRHDHGRRQSGPDSGRGGPGAKRKHSFGSARPARWLKKPPSRSRARTRIKPKNKRSCFLRGRTTAAWHCRSARWPAWRNSRAAHVEKSGGEWVIQYRGKILPLIRLDVVLEERRTRLRHAQAGRGARSAASARLP